MGSWVVFGVLRWVVRHLCMFRRTFGSYELLCFGRAGPKCDMIVMHNLLLHNCQAGSAAFEELLCCLLRSSLVRL